MNKIEYTFVFKLRNIFLPLILSTSIFQGLHAENSSTITITGTVTEAGCIISAESKEFTVDLLKHATKQMKNIGSSTSPVTFNISLSSCSDATSSVRVQFTGITDSINPSLLATNSGSAFASGVAVELLDNTMMSIPINSYSKWIKIVPKQENILNFNARISKTQPSIVPGSVISTATFILEYQ